MEKKPYTIVWITVGFYFNKTMLINHNFFENFKNSLHVDSKNLILLLLHYLEKEQSIYYYIFFYQFMFLFIIRPEEKIKQLEKKVNELIEESCFANSTGDLSLVNYLL